MNAEVKCGHARPLDNEDAPFRRGMLCWKAVSAAPERWRGDERDPFADEDGDNGDAELIDFFLIEE